MENIVGEIITQWGTFGILMIFAIWIIWTNIKDGIKVNKNTKNEVLDQSKPAQNDTLGELMATLISSLSDKIDKIDDKVDRLEINSNNINLKYLLALLNSKLLFWYFKDIGYNLGGKGYRYKKIFVEQLPIVITEDKNTEMNLTNLVDMIINENKKLINEINSFHKWLNRTFNIDKLSKKLENYYELDFEDFLKEIKKKKVDITKRKTQ